MMFMAGPLLLQYFATYGINIVSLAFVGHIGKQELAAAGTLGGGGQGGRAQRGTQREG